MKLSRQSRVNLRVAAVAAGAVLLTWLVLSRSVAAYLADTAPNSALWLNSSNPQALINLADRMLNGDGGAGAGAARPEPSDPAPETPPGADAGAPTAAASRDANRPFAAFDDLGQRNSVDLTAVRAWAGAGLTIDPLNARALRILGQAADAAHDETAAAKLMRAAARLSLNESVATSWLMVKSAEAKDYPQAIYYADIFLRMMPDYGAYVVPLLAHIAAEDPDSAGLLKTALVGDPPWRDAFLQGLPANVSDERIVLDFLLALRNTPHPPSADDVNRYLNFLVAHNLYSLAYYTWLQFLPAEQLRNAGLLYNGSFEIPQSGSPFDWTMSQGSGVTADVEARPDASGEHALVLNFQYGRVEYQSVAQLIMLAPGRYQFAGRYKGELVGPRGLRWRVACAENPTQPIAEGAMISGRASVWSDTELDFTVPGQNCWAQRLSLDLDARMPSEQFVTGAIWFDELRISRLASAASQ